MQLDIQLLNVSPEQAFTAKGDAYEKLIVTFKNLRLNKTEAKQIFPFGDKQLFAQLRELSPGFYSVTQEKNEKGYWDWKAIDRQDAPPVNGAASRPNGKPVSAPAGGRPQYETAEERAQRQVLIVKQSSLKEAVSFITATKKGATPEDVLELAQRFTDWVFGPAIESPQPTQKEAADPDDPFSDDIPF